MQNKNSLKLEDIFPDGCKIKLDSDGRLSLTAGMTFNFMLTNEENNIGLEYPCYNCVRTCEVRKVEYRDKKNRYFIQPSNTPCRKVSVEITEY